MHERPERCWWPLHCLAVGVSKVSAHWDLDDSAELKLWVARVLAQSASSPGEHCGLRTSAGFYQMALQHTQQHHTAALYAKIPQAEQPAVSAVGIAFAYGPSSGFQLVGDVQVEQSQGCARTWVAEAGAQAPLTRLVPGLLEVMLMHKSVWFGSFATGLAGKRSETGAQVKHPSIPGIVLTARLVQSTDESCWYGFTVETVFGGGKQPENIRRHQMKVSLMGEFSRHADPKVGVSFELL